MCNVDKIKTITVLTSDYPAPGHAANVFVQQLVHAMIDNGVKVTIIAYQSVVNKLIHRDKLLPRQSYAVTENGVEYRIYRPYTLSSGNRNFDLIKWFNRRIITTKVAEVGGDILYCHFWSAALNVYKYAILKKVPLFVACGEGDNDLENMVKTMSKDKLDLLAKAVTGVVSVSSENKRKCIEYKLIKPNDVDVFPNSVNTTLFHRMDVTSIKRKLGIKEDDFVVSFVGSFNHRKGPDRLAKAIKNLNDPKIKVMFIGKPFKGYDYDFDCPGIIHKGPLEHDMIPKYVNCSDVFVMPSQKEGCCNAIVEALAMGVPVIAANRPFNDDILDENNSIRINPDDVDALSKAIQTLRDNKDLRKFMSDYSLSHHNEYSIQDRAKRILEFINKQINKHRA